MKLSKIYQETLNEGNVWKKLESILRNGETLTEGLGGGLEPLLKEANTVIFAKFKICGILFTITWFIVYYIPF
jgi:hypothetical protein